MALLKNDLFMRWILFVLMCVGSQVWGQVEFAPVGAKWGMSYWSFASPNISYREMIVEKDTLFEGKLAKKILVGKNDGDNFTSQYNSFIHQSVDSIFVYSPNLNDYIYMYNFSLEVGDSITFQSLAYPTLTYYIDSIATEIINDIPLKIQYVSIMCPENNLKEERVFMEKIGPFSHDDVFLQDHLCLLDGQSYGFRCYSDPNFPEYVASHLVDNDIDCFITTATENIAETEHQIKVSPNPVQEHMQLTFSEALHHQELDIEVFSVQGVSILKTRKIKGEETMNLDIGDLSKGIYFIKSQTDYGFMQTIKIVKS